MKILFNSTVVEARKIHIDEFGRGTIYPIGNGFSMPEDIDFDITTVINQKGYFVKERLGPDDIIKRRSEILIEAINNHFVDLRKYAHHLNQ